MTAELKHLVVRNRRTGQPVAIPMSSIPEEIRPDNWFENPEWRYRPDKGRLEPIIFRYLEGCWKLSKEDAGAVAQYIVDYACHVAVMGYLFGGKENMEFNVECIRRLRALARTASAREDISTMISVGMDYALDPL